MAVVALVLTALALLVVGCDDGAEPTFDDVADGRVTPGTSVTVDGSAALIPTPDVLVLEKEGRRILVLHADAAGGPAIDVGEGVVVTGEAARLSDVAVPAAARSAIDTEALADTVIRADLVRERLAERAG